MSGDYALLRSEGTYEDFYKITKQNLAYDTTMEAVQWRISQLEAEADSAESEDEYAECMGRIAANKDNSVSRVFPRMSGDTMAAKFVYMRIPFV